VTVRRLGARAKDFTGIRANQDHHQHRHNMLIMVLLARIQLRPSFRSVLLAPSPFGFHGKVGNTRQEQCDQDPAKELFTCRTRDQIIV
jgi:hypothetical protein